MAGFSSSGSVPPAAERPIRSTAGLMVSPLDTFELFAELSLALAGFSGVAAAFGGRDRAYRPIEIARLALVLAFSGMSLVGALLVIAMTHAGLSSGDTYAASALVACVLFVAYAARHMPPVIKLYRAGESTTSGTYILFSLSYVCAVTVLLLWSALFEREAWPLIVTISSQLVYGLWVFSRLLLRAN